MLESADRLNLELEGIEESRRDKIRSIIGSPLVDVLDYPAGLLDQSPKLA